MKKMKKNKRTDTHKVLLTAALGAAAACGASAYEVPLSFLGTNMPPLEFHGFASQGFLYSGDYNYLANDTKNGSFQFSEVGLNVSMNPFPRTRITAQGFDYDVGNVGQYNPFLDYALVEYTFNDEVGIRAGRIRRPSGIYNHIQDVDLARTYVLLPQGVYDARFRDFSASLDGVDVFGDIPLGKAGSLAYETYAGMVSMPNNSGMARYIQNNLPPTPVGQFNSIDSTPVMGGQIWWNTPLNGLRAGASFAYLSNFGYHVNIAPPYGPGAMHCVGNVPIQQYSLEYVWKDWTFQTEYYTYDFTGHFYAPAYGNLAVGPNADNPDAWYFAVSHRFNKLIEAGAYYTQFHDKPLTANQGSFQKDAALSLRFDIKDWWIFKVEGHYIQGTGLLRDNADNSNLGSDHGWFMLAVKTTFSF